LQPVHSEPDARDKDFAAANEFDAIAPE